MWAFDDAFAVPLPSPWRMPLGKMLRPSEDAVKRHPTHFGEQRGPPGGAALALAFSKRCPEREAAATPWGREPSVKVTGALGFLR